MKKPVSLKDLRSLLPPMSPMVAVPPTKSVAIENGDTVERSQAVTTQPAPGTGRASVVALRSQAGSPKKGSERWWQERIGQAFLISGGSRQGVAAVEDVRRTDAGLEVLCVHPHEVRTWRDASALEFQEAIDTSPTFDETAFPQERALLEQWLADNPTSLPELAVQPFEITGKTSTQYNCIAHSLRVDDSWVWPAGSRVRDFDELYRNHGFVRLTGMDARLIPGVEKVILFGHKPGTMSYFIEYMRARQADDPLDDGPVCTHAIVQDADGAWSSKNGDAQRVRTQSHESYIGRGCGEPLVMYARTRPSIPEA